MPRWASRSMVSVRSNRVPTCPRRPASDWFREPIWVSSKSIRVFAAASPFAVAKEARPRTPLVSTVSPSTGPDCALVEAAMSAMTTELPAPPSMIRFSALVIAFAPTAVEPAKAAGAPAPIAVAPAAPAEARLPTARERSPIALVFAPNAMASTPVAEAAAPLEFTSIYFMPAPREAIAASFAPRRAVLSAMSAVF